MRARARREVAPHAVLRGGRQPGGGTGGIDFDFPDRALGGGVVVGDLQVRARLVDRDGADGEDAQAGDHDELSRQRGAAGAQPVQRGEHGEQREQVAELQAEREAEADLPCRHQPPGDDQCGGASPVAAQQQEQRERDAAGGDHVQVARLGHAVGGVGESRGGGRGAELAQTELACEQVAGDEAQRPGEQEQQVVADERRHGARAEEAGRAVAEQRVGEGEAQRVRIEGVGVEQVQRVVQHRVTDVGDLPGCAHGIAEVGRDAAGQVQHERPAGQHRQRDAGENRPRDLGAAELR